MKQELLLIGIVLIIVMIYFSSQKKNTLDKVRVQQELNDTLTILNKPTEEMETQTDLTAEQITQMEKLLYQGAMEIEKLEQQLIKIEEEKDNESHHQSHH